LAANLVEIALYFLFLMIIITIWSGELDKTALSTAYEHLARRYDDEYASFGLAPEFPAPLHALLDIIRFAKFAENKAGIDGEAAAYVCRSYACQFPTTDVSEMLELPSAG